ncbi:MAG: caspase family protein [Tannerellaceae bacterium]|jgi:hypothetical protein|nr:caspase family protein [Tannerellaceae bacterium]
MKKVILLIAFGICLHPLCGQNASSSKPIKIVLGTDTLREIPPAHFPPELEIYELSLRSERPGVVSAEEQGCLTFKIKNTGQGGAYNLRLYTSEKNGLEGIQYDAHKYITQRLEPGETRTDSIFINGRRNLQEGKALFELFLSEANGHKSSPVPLSVQTKEFDVPKLVIASSEIQPLDENEMQLLMSIQNIGSSNVKNIKVNIDAPSSVYKKGKSEETVQLLKPDEAKEIRFTFAKNRSYAESNKHTFTILLEEEKGLLNIREAVSTAPTAATALNTLSSVDLNIPQATSEEKKEKTYALIIGNENYLKNTDVQFAIKDARIFREYCRKTFNIPTENIVLIQNATGNQMKESLRWLARQARYAEGKAELIVYYSGHGTVDKTSNGEEYDQYLVPVDVSGFDASLSISRKDIYAALSDVSFKRASLFLDACYSGGDRALKKVPKYDWKGNFVVFASSSFDQVSSPYPEEQHGFFTYFLLKNIQESKGKINLAELTERVTKEVERCSEEKASKKQKPELIVSPEAGEAWKKWKITD